MNYPKLFIGQPTSLIFVTYTFLLFFITTRIGGIVAFYLATPFTFKHHHHRHNHHRQNNVPKYICHQHSLTKGIDEIQSKPQVPDFLSENKIFPPEPYRDNYRVVWAGKNKGQFSAYRLQSEDSSNPLLSPAQPIPDPYGWMRDESRTSQLVLNHISAEHEYLESITSHLSSSRQELMKEMKNYLQETDYTAPILANEYGNNSFQWVYYTRSFKDNSYNVYCRAPAPPAISSYYSKKKTLRTKRSYYTRSLKGNSYNVYCRAPKNPFRTNISSSFSERDSTAWIDDPNAPIFPGELQYLDVNKLAQSMKTENSNYCAIGQVKPSPSHKYVAYSVDTTGNEKCQLYIKNLETMQVVKEFRTEANQEPFEMDGLIVWGKDDSSIFYVKKDKNCRPFRVYRRMLSFENDDNGKEELIYEEKDERFNVYIYKSQNGHYLFIESASAETSEVMYVDLLNLCLDNSKDDSCDIVQTVAKRRSKVLYFIEHYKNHWLITTNYNSKMCDDMNGVKPMPNMRLMISPDIPNCSNHWEDLCLLRNDAGENNSSEPAKTVLFDGEKGDKALNRVTPFQNHIVCEGRQGGIPRIWIIGFLDNASNVQKTLNSNEHSNMLQASSFHQITFEEPAHNVILDATNNFSTNKVNVQYTSLVTPFETIAINMDNPGKDRLTLKCRVVPNYKKSLYKSHRTLVTSRDGTVKIPVSMVYRPDLVGFDSFEDITSAGRDGKLNKDVVKNVPVHLVGYGSYGSTLEANFDMTRLPLLDRGFVYVLAHVRGGGEMGRNWYEEPNGGKFLCKMNTFDDFVDVAKWLIGDGEHDKRVKISSPEKLSCEGR